VKRQPRQEQQPLSSGDYLAREEIHLQEAYARRKNVYSRFNPGDLFILQQREQQILGLLRRRGWASLRTKKILEIGCGTGDFLRDLVKWGARPENVTGIDLLDDRIAQARHLCPKEMRIEHANAAELSYPNDYFDLVVQSTVFTSVLDPNVKTRMAREMRRVLKPDGLILWYDFFLNNPYNPDVRGVKRGEIRELFSGCDFELQRITLLPPLARLLVPYSWVLCCMLENIPWLCSHYIGVISKEKFL
jgi:ubiquinone/menaquinone biosynthesis C-methylase UbiE